MKNQGTRYLLLRSYPRTDSSLTRRVAIPAKNSGSVNTIDDESSSAGAAGLGGAGAGRGASVAPAANARTAEQFDTTTADERAAAAAPKAGGERSLGTSVASLGDPSKPGFWLETPLVTSPTQGRVRYPGSGKSARVELLPIDGATTSGSRISLAAMRLIEAPLTDLPTLEVYAGG